MKKIRPLRMGEDTIVANNAIARDALAELEESGDPVRVILRMAEEMREMQEREDEAMKILEKANQKLQEIVEMVQ